MTEHEITAPWIAEVVPGTQTDKSREGCDANPQEEGSARAPVANLATPGPACTDLPTRRGFLRSSARKIAYTAPVVLLFKPDQARAGSGGTEITLPP